MKKLFDFNIKEANENRSNVYVEAVEDSIKDIAIIGIAARLPLAENIKEFWNNLRMGIDCIRSIPGNRKRDIDNILQYYNIEKYALKEMYYLEEIDKFDHHFFGYSPKEASLMDPNHRMFLETAWSAIEESGYGGEKLIGSRTGVYVAYKSDSRYENLVNNIEPSYAAIALPGNFEPILASRISYLLNLKGPSMIINTACSSSLVALHLACQGIRNGECNMAVVGGIQLSLLPLKLDQGIGVESSDGRTKTFDDNSDGTNDGEGVAAVVIKPLHKAMEDRDHIHAIIKGSWINQDGTSVNITAPNPEAQEDVIVGAWKNAGIDPLTISYIEAHGTGTKLGDPIELDGIQRAFGRFTHLKQFCAVGSVKSNIGHLGHAAGMAGVIKAALALKYKELPPSLHFNLPNRKIDFGDLPVYVNHKLRKWITGGFPRRAGVSAFGLSGTNCHVILEETPKIEEPETNENLNILALSGKSKKALKELVDKYYDFLKSMTSCSMNDICYTANTGRGHYNYRLAIIADNKEDLCNKMEKIRKTNFSEIKEKEIHYGEYFVKSDQKSTIEEGASNVFNSLNWSSEQRIKECVESKRKDRFILDEIAALYIKGAHIEWDKMYAGEKLKRISLPTYSFERTRCWLEIPQQPIKQELPQNKEIFFAKKWKYKALEQDKKEDSKGSVLVLIDHPGNEDTLLKEVREKEKNTVEVFMGDRYVKYDKNKYQVAVSEKGFERLFEELQGMAITKIIHLSTIKREGSEIKHIDELIENQKKGVYSVFYLFKALCKAYIEDNMELLLVSENVSEVTGSEENIYPENATLFGLGKILNCENARIKCRCIDIDRYTELASIVDELTSASKDTMVTYRSGGRFVEEIVKVDVDSIENHEVKIVEDGAYIITGGLGGIGIEIIRYLASKNKVNIVLINRSKMPPRKEWNSIIEKDENQKLAYKLKTILEAEKEGCKIECYSGDISNRNHMAAIFEEVKRIHGKINGIIHGAGIAGDGFLMNKDEQTFNEVLLPKVEGTWILDELTKEEQLDFFVMFSSINTIIESAGQCDYTAANSYLDSFQAYRRKNGKKALTINWAGWKETGMAADKGVNTDGTFKVLSTATAIAAFDKVLNKNISQVVIGQLNYDYKMIHELVNKDSISDEIKGDILKLKASKTSQNTFAERKMHPVSLTGKDGMEYSELEKRIAFIMGNVLGLNQIDIDDNFFELGGNSLSAIKLDADMEKYNIPLRFNDVYNQKTVKGMALYVEGKSKGIKTVEEKQERKRNEVVPENKKYELQLVNNHVGHRIENIDPFNDLFYKNCFYNSLFPIIKHFNKNIMTFLVNDIFIYQYENIDKNPKGFDSEYISAKTNDELLAGMGLGMAVKYSATNIIKDLITSIAHNNPVIIWVDCFYASIRDDTYQKEHIAHTWLVYGYDEANQVCHIIEHKHRDNLSYEKRIISFEDVINSYSGYIDNFLHNSHMPSYMEFYLIDESNLDMNNFNQDAPIHRRTFAENSLKNMDQILKKLDCIKEFTKEISTTIQDTTNLYENMERIFNILNNIINHKKVEIYRITKLFEHETNLASLLEEIFESWNYIRTIIGKYLYTSFYNQSDFDTLLGELEKIYAMEHEYNHRLFQICSDYKNGM